MFLIIFALLTTIIMDNMHHTTPPATLLATLAAILIAGAFIVIMSLVPEPRRQKLNAIIVAGAGSVYWSAGFGIWEFAFGGAMLVVAFNGLKHYYFIGIGWLLHTTWDILHHLYGAPIVYLEPSSSYGCAVCDPILALWFFFKAPSVFHLSKRSKQLA